MDRHRVVGKENDKAHLNRESRMQRLLQVKRQVHELDRDSKPSRLSKDGRSTLNKKASKSSELKPNPPPSDTSLFCEQYRPELGSEVKGTSKAIVLFLGGHDIDRSLRGRMLDWMVEVTSSYKFEPRTYFLGATLMDRYFAVEGSRVNGRLPITKLHIVGVTAMLLASKLNEVYPLKIRTVYEKIVHRKIEKKELVEMEAKMTTALDYELSLPDFCDMAVVRLHQLAHCPDSVHALV